MELNLKVIEIPLNIVILSITGSVKAGYLAPLEDEFKKLYQGPPVKLILNVQGIQSIDSSGISELIKARNFIVERGGKVALVGIHSRVEMMIKMSGLDNYFPVLSTESDAIHLLKEPPAESAKSTL